MLPTVGEIHIRRKKLGLTQAELAKQAGVSQSLIAKVESEQIGASYELLKRVFECMEELENKTQPSASEVMNTKIISVHAKDPLNKAVSLMRKNDISQLPVFKEEHVIGSISESSILEKMAQGMNTKALAHSLCEDALSEPFPLVSETTPLSAVSELLKHHFAVLVRSKGKIAGIITRSDLLKVVKY